VVVGAVASAPPKPTPVAADAPVAAAQPLRLAAKRAEAWNARSRRPRGSIALVVWGRRERELRLPSQAGGKSKNRTHRALVSLCSSRFPPL
jgi:hypothetical protein